MKNILLLVLVVFSVFIRLYQLDSTPGSLHNDEIANTYAGRFIIENGKDLFGNSFPILYLDKFGDYPPVLPMYLSGIGTYLFGINEFGSRFGIALIGGLSVLPFFLIAFYLYKRYYVALLTSLVFSLLPWHFVLSRSNAEGIVGLFVYLWGFYLIIYAYSKKNFKYFFVATVLLLLTYLLYPSYRIFIPLTFLSFTVYGFIKKDRFITYTNVSGLMVSLLLTTYISTTLWGKGRFNQTSLFTDLSGVRIMVQELTYNETSPFLARLFNNKIIGYLFKFTEQYLEYFSPKFLFTHGGEALVYKIPYFGVLFYTFIFAFILHIFKLHANKHTYKMPILLLIMLLMAPIPSALTIVETPNIHRSLQMSIFFVSLFGCFIYEVLERKNRFIVISFTLVFFIEVIFFMHNYFQHTRFTQAPYRNDGNKQLVHYIAKNKNSYQKIFVSDREAWLPSTYLFYTKDFNTKYIGSFTENFRLSQIGNIYFPNSDCLEEEMIQNTNIHTLFLIPNDCEVNPIYKEIAVIRKLNKAAHFRAYRFFQEP